MRSSPQPPQRSSSPIGVGSIEELERVCSLDLGIRVCNVGKRIVSIYATETASPQHRKPQLRLF
jgi:hypothetical protein